MTVMSIPQHDPLARRDFAGRIEGLLRQRPAPRTLVIDHPAADLPTPPAPVTRVPYLHLLLAGSATVRDRAGAHRLAAGDAVFFPAGSVADHARGPHLRYLRATWDEDLVFAGLADTRVLHPHSISGLVLPGAVSPLEARCHERLDSLQGSCDDPLASALISALLGELLWRCRHTDAQRLHSANRWQSILGMMRRKCCERGFDRAMAARAAGISPSHLSRLMREHHDGTFGELLHELRIKRARKLLQDRHLSIAEVAQRTGYRTTSHFIQVFRRRQGCTPRVWREGRGTGAETGQT